MGLKVLGVLCAGVFVGAALMEIRQLGWRKPRDRSDDDRTDGDDETTDVADNEDEDGAPEPSR